MISRRLAAVAILVIATVTAACGSGTSAAAPASAPADPVVDAAAATTMATRALTGFNEGDYAAWSADWSDTMKAAIDEPAFLAAREQLMATLGKYVSLSDPQLGSYVPGTYRWTFAVAFEQQPATFWISFKGDSPRIEGVRFE